MNDHIGAGPVTAPAAEPTEHAEPAAPPRLTTRLDALLANLGVTGPFARDCLLAVGVAGLTFMLMAALFWVVTPPGEIVLGPGQAWLLVALGVGQALLLCLRRVRPLVCLASVVGLQAVMIALSPPDATIRGLAPLVVAYTIGVLLPARTALALVGVAVAVETAAAFGTAAVSTPDLLLAAIGPAGSSLLSNLGAVVVGNYVATRRSYVQLLRLQAADAVRAQQAKVRAAIGAERTQMARELHDVAAHHLSGMVVQAAAVHRLIDRDPAAAKEGVAWIRAQGKETLDNLRLVVGVLRGTPADRSGGGDAPGPDGEGSVPVPGLAVLDALVRTARDLGTPVEFVGEGSPRPVSPIADVALYRMVQESLSNARQHAPGAPVLITLRYLPREVSLTVVNDPPARRPEPAARTSSGVGLVGMRERAQLIGARFAAGPTAEGGWSVTVAQTDNGGERR
ncbi:sensor histidine kinase [Micromonospora sp. NBC_01813]|uniref:sensor histidine kinase n=1 Tax=Micromonospora sp. NBC_01813 TaxID=2975988 RepID=UPI002DD8A96B|nr:histidine kinase [Micromonospora sp. NBC_01813]WSA08647.1 histidine kinase [Micromonospora sp. NBC_01813]